MVGVLVYIPDGIHFTCWAAQKPVMSSHALWAVLICILNQ